MANCIAKKSPRALRFPPFSKGESKGDLEEGKLDLTALGQSLCMLGTTGRVSGVTESVREVLVTTGVADEGADRELVATSRLFALGVARAVTGAIRRVLSLLGEYRAHLLDQLCAGLRTLPDDKALADTLERLDHSSPELLTRVEAASPPQPSPARGEGALGGYSMKKKSDKVAPSPWPSPHRGEGIIERPPHRREGTQESRFARWDVEIWQAPDAITLLAKVVENPEDFPEQPTGPKVPVGFDWLSWDTPPAIPAPAPWGDNEPLQHALSTTRHPFWGALVATLDACTGDYEWQSLMLRGGVLRSRHRALGKAEELLRQLWSRELGLYPTPPFVLPKDITFIPGKPIPWLQPVLGRLAEAGVATQAEGSWRLTDAFRTQLMKDDEHMLTFEAVRKRSYRLARAAEQITEQTLQAVAQ